MNIRFELYKKCVRGECTPEEASQVENWLKEDPKIFEAEMLAEIMQMEKDKEMPFTLKQEMMDYFRLKGVPVLPEPAAQPAMKADIGTVHVRRKLGWAGWAAAASIIVAVVTVWVLRRNEPASRPGEWMTVVNNSKEVKLIILPDSSKIWLNAFAKVSYPAHFDKQARREVKLDGEAYFIVKTQVERAFVVESGSVQTWVLGTEFNIEAYPDEDMIRVSLQQGKVRVNYLQKDSSRSEGKVLLPGEMAVYQKGSTLLSVGKTAVVEPHAWIKEGLVLNDVSLRDALNRIGRKYDQVLVFDSLRASKYPHITAHYHHMDIEQLLDQLGFTCGFKFKRTNTGYHIIIR